MFRRASGSTNKNPSPDGIYLGSAKKLALPDTSMALPLQKNPGRAFKKAGIFFAQLIFIMKNRFATSIALIIIMSIPVACSKKNSSPLSHASEMNGTHTWHGTYTLFVGGFLDTSYNYLDTFSIVVVNESTLVIRHDTLRYISNSNDTLWYENDRTPYGGPGKYLLEEIAYNYSHKSIFYERLFSPPGRDEDKKLFAP
jgi:hypothetical protein